MKLLCVSPKDGMYDPAFAVAAKVMVKATGAVNILSLDGDPTIEVPEQHVKAVAAALAEMP